MNYWLFKSEPSEYSIDNLKQEGTTVWNGIRNYQARNYLRDEVKEGDGVLFYHSSCKPTAIVGSAIIVRSAYPDPSQFDEQSPYFDPKSTPESPRWVCVDIEFDTKFSKPILLSTVKNEPLLKDMTLINRGRLSIQPVTPKEWATTIKMGK